MGAKKPAAHSIWTPANVVTCARVVLVPLWVAYALYAGMATGQATVGGLAVAVSFGLLALTDRLDGYLARSRGEVTVFGKFLDPIADKLVVVCGFLVLMSWGLISPWPLIIIVAREFLVSGLRMVVASEGIVVAASSLGKWKTATTMVCIVGFLFFAELSASVVADALYLVCEGALVAALILTIWSGVDYFWKARSTFIGSGSTPPTSATGTTKVAAATLRHAVTDSQPALSWDDAVALAATTLAASRERGETLGTAESCTGGLVEAALTAVPGSSDVVVGGIGSYACSVKHAVLGVSAEVLDSVGPISPECARQMAEGARRTLGCDVAVSVTGIAGPGGAEPNKPVGLVWFGLADAAGTRTERVIFPGDRPEVRLRAVIHALGLLREG